MSDVSVRILGSIELEAGGEVVDLPRRQLRALVTIFALAPGSLVLVDHLIEALWPSQAPRRPRHALHVYVSRLRNLHQSVAAALCTVPGGYRLECLPENIDVANFERLVQAARSQLTTAPDETLRLLTEALGLWRGPALGDLHYQEFAQGAVRRLEELRVVAEEDRCDAALRMESSWDPIPILMELVRDHPLRERPIALLLDALHQRGRSNEAVLRFGEYRAALVQQFGVEPSPHLAGLARVPAASF